MFIRIQQYNGILEQGFRRLGDFQVWHETNSIEYYHENSQFWVLLDTNIDQTRKMEVAMKLGTLTDINPKTIGKNFNENFFMVAIDKQNSQIHLVRDSAGVKTGYYTFEDGEMMISTLMHDLALSKGKVKFSKEAIHQVLYSNYLLDGFTYYEGIHEVPAGQHNAYDRVLDKVISKNYPVHFQEENGLTANLNFKLLREKTQEAHRGYLAPKNTVLLSGGLDSIAMLIALDDMPETEQLENISFRVKDTEQDETVYAVDAAEKVGRPLSIKQIDPDSSQNFTDFEQTFLQMNNPYHGVWIFGQFSGTLEEMFYAGQDTRLHTPALNEVDKMAFAFLPYQNSFWFKYLVTPLINSGKRIFKYFNWHKSSNRIFKNLWKGLHLTDLKAYVDTFYLKLGKDKIAKKGLPTDYYDSFRKHFDFDISKIKSKRGLYNQLVAKKWKEQYIFDIRYLQDVARMNQTYIAMPFYNPHLASFSSSIPFDLAMKKMVGRSRFGKTKAIIYKYVLRHAFRDKLTDKCFYRAKAVSQTFHQLNNGVMGQKLKAILERDLAMENSFIKSFQLESFVQKYLEVENWEMGQEDYLGTIYYIAALSIYHYRVVLKQQDIVQKVQTAPARNRVGQR